MKILVVCQYYAPEPFRISDICESLVSMGHEVVVLTGTPNYPTGKIYPGYEWFRKCLEIVSGVKVVRVPVVPRGQSRIQLLMNYLSFALISCIWVGFFKHNFDVVYVHQLSPITMALPALLFKKITGKRVLLYCLDIWPESIVAANITRSSPVYSLLLGVSRWIYHEVDSVCVSSLSFIQYLKESIKLDIEDKNYLPQFAEDLYMSVPSDDLQSPEGPVCLLFAGNIGEMQSVETIIRAASKLKDLENVQWHIVGDGSARKKCENMTRELRLTNHVFFYGQRPATEMPAFFSKASALLVTLKRHDYISYTLPGKVQSYMAAGKPIIGAIDGDAKKIIEESGCGLCCEAENHEALAKLIRQFVSEPWKVKLYSSNSLKYYNENFRKSVFMRHLVSKLQNLCGQNPSNISPYEKNI
ncbi:MAG: glycosyltransferase family 4 protein [Syntrophales bacterium]